MLILGEAGEGCMGTLLFWQLPVSLKLFQNKKQKKKKKTTQKRMACEPQLLSPCATTTEACAPRARALQQEKPLQ